MFRDTFALKIDSNLSNETAKCLMLKPFLLQT